MGLLHCLVALAIISHTNSSSIKSSLGPSCSSILSKFSKLEILKEEEIVPQLVDTVPNSILEVSYKDKIADFGNFIKPWEAREKPKIKIDGLDTKKFYLLAMIDPDVPSRANPTFREGKHWLVGNIPGSSLDLERGISMADYGGPGPPKGSGKHRYIFFLYAQPEALDWSSEVIPKNSSKSNPYEGRPNWSLRKFAKKYNLGRPIAANFFQSEFYE